jgi:hypothetical protein
VPRWSAWLVCALGAFLVVAGYQLWRAGRESRSYTRARARILRAQVEEIPHPSEEGGTKYRPVVRYAFEVGGRTYESDRVAIGAPAAPDAADAGDARRLVERFAAGAEVDVWFDPRDPRRSVLERGVPTSQIAAAVVFGIALLAVGMFALGR